MPNPKALPWCQPMTPTDLKQILDLTIDCDNANKITTFLCLLSAYTTDSQFNISFNAPSSTGKSYIPTQIAELFPAEDVRRIAYCSPKAFFHEIGTYDRQTKRHIVDLSRKILIFLDQPHNELLARLRPMLSHDEPEIAIKITDRSRNSGLRTKDVRLRGYPAVIFCTAGLQIDEQEATRFLFLSPDMDQDKLQKAVTSAALREADKAVFKARLESDMDRRLLIRRLAAIKAEGIEDVTITNPGAITKLFVGTVTPLLPRHQRDVKRLISLVKAFALLNLWWRTRHGQIIYANDNDVEWAIDLWMHIREGQDLNLPPYVYSIFNDIISPLCKTQGGRKAISRSDLQRRYLELYGRHANERQMRTQILPMLESAGLLQQVPDPQDRRRQLIALP